MIACSTLRNCSKKYDVDRRAKIHLLTYAFNVTVGPDYDVDVDLQVPTRVNHLQCDVVDPADPLPRPRRAPKWR